MKSLLGRFTKWFNRTHNRKGTLWEERFKSVSAVAAIGGLLFGFDTGVIAANIPGITSAFDLDEWQVGFAVSNLVIAYIIGAFVIGQPTDKFSRKKLLIMAGLFFTVSAVLSAVPPSITSSCSSRASSGFLGLVFTRCSHRFTSQKLHQPACAVAWSP